MLWEKESAKLDAEMPQHWARLGDSIRQHWRTGFVYRNDKGKLHTTLHDAMNVVVEAGRIDPYMVVHRLMLVIGMLALALVL